MTDQEKLNRWIAGDVCTCTHSRLVHNDRFIAIGHGECRAQGCPCERFTWSHNTMGANERKSLKK